MGFEISHKTANGTLGYRQLGNAVIPKMIEQIWDCIKGL